MRDRLIELINKATDKTLETGELVTNEQLAEYLLANGVIVPPCKVGDKVYRPSKCLGVVQFVIISFIAYQSEMFYTDDSDNIIYIPDIGKTVFLSREEAEQKLKEGAK